MAIIAPLIPSEFSFLVFVRDLIGFIASGEIAGMVGGKSVAVDRG
ncbi:MAG TPA: hypothetical protein VKB86_14825 [Pyrinomonadaceae bacterium]|nr:hypothetical protein [Pyrinomonadaceae bacterium]